MLVICELVVEKGVDVAAMSDDGITALIAAASEGHAGIVELLLGEKANADPDAKDKVRPKPKYASWFVGELNCCCMNVCPVSTDQVHSTFWGIKNFAARLTGTPSPSTLFYQ